MAHAELVKADIYESGRRGTLGCCETEGAWGEGDGSAPTQGPRLTEMAPRRPLGATTVHWSQLDQRGGPRTGFGTEKSATCTGTQSGRFPGPRCVAMCVERARVHKGPGAPRCTGESPHTRCPNGLQRSHCLPRIERTAPPGWARSPPERHVEARWFQVRGSGTHCAQGFAGKSNA